MARLFPCLFAIPGWNGRKEASQPSGPRSGCPRTARSGEGPDQQPEHRRNQHTQDQGEPGMRLPGGADPAYTNPTGTAPQANAHRNTRGCIRVSPARQG
jgi:hypothetical protein